MILSDQDLQARVLDGTNWTKSQVQEQLDDDTSIVLAPWSAAETAQITEASITLHLFHTILQPPAYAETAVRNPIHRPKIVPGLVVDPNDGSWWQKYLEQCTARVLHKDEINFTIYPGEMILGMTIEHLAIPRTIRGRVRNKTRFARCGLQVEMADGINPGFAGTIILEIVNLGSAPIALFSQMPIVEVEFELLSSRCATGYNDRANSSGWQSYELFMPR